MKKVFEILLFFASCFLYAQTRADIVVGIPKPMGGTPEQQVYFYENFIMETIAAGYTVSENPLDADYTLQLEIKRNKIHFNDGTEEDAPPEAGLFVLGVHLLDNEGNSEIVYFEFSFTELIEMNQYNLYLLYNAMANIPLTKLTDAVEPVRSDQWRNKWLYIRSSFDYSIITYQVDTNQPNTQDSGGVLSQIPSDNAQVSRSPLGFTLGIEIQFLNWLSAEIYGKIMFGDTGEIGFVPAAGLELKFPLKPAQPFMIAPYAIAELPLNSGAGIQAFSPLGVGAGVQFGAKGGEIGAFFLDAHFIYNLGDIYIVEKIDNVTRDAHWKRWILGFGIGYKAGFLNRRAGSL